MRDVALNSRLLSAAELVRQDAVFADIGTDHAYLPVFLLKKGKISRAYASDINKGPLMRAEENARAAGLSDKITLTLSDGAAHLKLCGITDYAICGMGGELIASIIDAAPHLKDSSVRLILGPNSRQGHLRAYLSENGFEILEELYSFDAGKYYLTLLAEYTGKAKALDPITAELGREMTDNVNLDCHIGYIEGKITAYKTALSGKKLGGLDTSFEEKMLEALALRLEVLKKSK